MQTETLIVIHLLLSLYLSTHSEIQPSAAEPTRRRHTVSLYGVHDRTARSSPMITEHSLSLSPAALEPRKRGRPNPVALARPAHASTAPLTPTSLLWSAHSTPRLDVDHHIRARPATHPTHHRRQAHIAPHRPQRTSSVRQPPVHWWAATATNAYASRGGRAQEALSPLRPCPLPPGPHPVAAAPNAHTRGGCARTVRFYATELAYLLLESASAAAFGTNFFL